MIVYQRVLVIEIGTDHRCSLSFRNESASNIIMEKLPKIIKGFRLFDDDPSSFFMFDFDIQCFLVPSYPYFAQ